MNRPPEWSRSTVRKFADSNEEASLSLVRRRVNAVFAEAVRYGPVDPRDSRAVSRVVDDVRRTLRLKGYAHGHSKVQRYVEDALREVWRPLSSG